MKYIIRGKKREILNNRNSYYSILKNMLNRHSNSMDIAATNYIW